MRGKWHQSSCPSNANHYNEECSSSSSRWGCQWWEWYTCRWRGSCSGRSVAGLTTWLALDARLTGGLSLNSAVCQSLSIPALGLSSRKTSLSSARTWHVDTWHEAPCHLVSILIIIIVHLQQQQQLRMRRTRVRCVSADAIHCMRRCFHNEYIDERGLLRLAATAQHCSRLTHHYAVAWRQKSQQYNLHFD